MLGQKTFLTDIYAVSHKGSPAKKKYDENTLKEIKIKNQKNDFKYSPCHVKNHSVIQMKQ